MLHCKLFYKEKLLQQSNNSHLLTFYCDQINHEWLKNTSFQPLYILLGCIFVFYLLQLKKKKKLILNLGAPLNSCYMILYNLELLLAAFSFAFNDVYAANSMRVYVKTYFHVYLDKPLDKLHFFY